MFFSILLGSTLPFLFLLFFSFFKGLFVHFIVCVVFGYSWGSGDVCRGVAGDVYRDQQHAGYGGDRGLAGLRLGAVPSSAVVSTLIHPREKVVCVRVSDFDFDVATKE